MQKPKFLLEERFDPSNMDMFEGKTFLSWIASKLSEDQYLKIMLTEKDCNFIGSLFADMLILAGVMSPLECKGKSHSSCLKRNSD